MALRNDINDNYAWLNWLVAAAMLLSIIFLSLVFHTIAAPFGGDDVSGYAILATGLGAIGLCLAALITVLSKRQNATRKRRLVTSGMIVALAAANILMLLAITSVL